MNILALGAHPDDIEYGCGGMLAKYAQRGHAVHMFVASDGADARLDRSISSNAMMRQAVALFDGELVRISPCARETTT